VVGPAAAALTAAVSRAGGCVPICVVGSSSLFSCSTAFGDFAGSGEELELENGIRLRKVDHRFLAGLGVLVTLLSVDGMFLIGSKDEYFS
jgi:hypothetical protein